MEINGIKLIVKLVAQTPMIHFQSKQLGVTLRASEVKPKLDRFIIDLIIKEEKLKGINDVKEKYPSFFRNSDLNDALDYKMHIVDNDGKKEHIDLKQFSLFYGNMGVAEEDKKYGVVSNPEVTIICLNRKLREKIIENIEKFFIVTNFGTMQNKGFGSFIPESWVSGNDREKSQEIVVAQYFKEYMGTRCFKYVFPENKSSKEIMDFIKDFYSVMKSGYNRGENKYARSYIYQYMHKKYQKGNEKAWMKKNDIAPKVIAPSRQKLDKITDDELDKQKGNHEYYYVRAFLGLGEKVEFGTQYNDRGFISNKQTIEIKEKQIKDKKEKMFERLNSPILFKVVKNVVYIVANPVPDELYGVEFEFVNKKTRNRGVLSVPKKEDLTDGEFNVQDFLSEYVKYFNCELKNNVEYFNKYKEIKEVKINE